MIVNFNGHRSAITTLEFDTTGTRLASGSNDTDIILWDLIAEVGIFKLRGHKEKITGIKLLQIPLETPNDEEVHAGSPTADFLLSVSKEASMKLWDLQSRHCIETRIAHSNGECWSLGTSPDLSGCITGGNDGELKVWAINLEGLRTYATKTVDLPETQLLRDRGLFQRQGKNKTTGILFHPRHSYFALFGSEKAVEIWRIRSEQEVRKSLARKRKRRREKPSAGDFQIQDEEEAEDITSASISDIFLLHNIVRPGGKTRSVQWAHSFISTELRMLISTTNNQLEHVSITKTASKIDPAEYANLCSIDLPGHRTDIRTVSISSNDRMLASASSGLLKIWNIQTQTCLRTLDCGYALCCTFLPGDKIVAVGTKQGEVELFDIASSGLVERVKAHDGAIWTMDLQPDESVLVTGSADKSAKFWKISVVHEDIAGTRRSTSRLGLTYVRSLKMNDDILSLKFTPDGRLLAVSTLDNTVKVYFVDSLNLFLKLYGHKLPVLSMSVASDSKLIATCSADKNIRLWGLDFGDCHKAIFGHADSIMQVHFIPHPLLKEETHQFFTASKDRLVKSWDGEKFQQIQKLEGHQGEIWAMAVSRVGDFVVTAAHDKSIRVWSRTDEPLFLEEEREREMEELYESTLITSLDADNLDDNANEAEVGAATKQTVATLTAGERIAEALELGLADLNAIEAWSRQKSANPKLAPLARSPTFIALGDISAERHVLNVISKIPAAQLYDALLVLPFSILPALLTFITIWVPKGWNIPLVCRVLFFMLKTHHKQIVASKELKGMLDGLRKDLHATLKLQKDMMGFNLAALSYIGDKVKEQSIRTIEDAELSDSQNAKKRAFVDVG